MAGDKTVKLFKIASEINIGRDTIVEYLQGKGFDIQNKPTATLTEQMVDLILDKFKKEKKAADIQREKLQKHKDLRQEPKKVEPVVDVHSPIVTKVPAAKPIEDEIVVNKVVNKSDSENKNNPDSYLNEIKQPVILGKIDLSSSNKPSQKPKEEVKVEHKEEIKQDPKPLVIEEKKSAEAAPIESPKIIDEVISESPKIIEPKITSEIKIEVQDKSKDDSVKKEEPITPVIKEIVKENVEQKSESKTETKVEQKVNIDISNKKEVISTKEDHANKQKVHPDKPENKAKTEERERAEKQADIKKFLEQNIEKQHNKDNKNRQGDNKGKDDSRFRDDNRNRDNRNRDNIQGNKSGENKNDDRKRFDKGDNKFKNDPTKQDNQKRNDRNKKKKRPNENEPGIAPQLRGLTVVGKIELEPEKDLTQNKPDKNKQSKDFNRQDGQKNKQFKKRKHTGEGVSDFREIIKEQLDNKFKAKEKDKDKEKEKEKITIKESVDKIEDKKKKKKKKTIREMISQEEVNRAIRETLAGMDLSGASSRTKNKLKKKAEREEKELRLKEEKLRDEKTLELTEFVTTSDLANLMGISPSEIIMKCMQLGLMVTINQRLDKETIILIADDYGFEIEFLNEKESQFVEEDIDDIETLKPRPPIVTIMGHVDHGKTSLLDYIRSANVVAGEAGGITQHIGAYKVKLPNDKNITFLDTPGHEAFTAMRARGAQVTDIVVLVVAADDSVMPQTIEAISHAKAANVPIVVAINKIDKPDANPDRIKQQLADQNVLVEEWGGKYQSVHISAKKGLNIEELLDKILLEAEFLDLKANPDRDARGIVIESNMKQGFGPVATIIVQKGTLSVGDPFVAGVSFGKVRALLDERERKLPLAEPGDPILVVGFDEVPEAGDSFVVFGSDQEARQIAIERKQLRREQELRQIHHKTLDEISAQIQIGGIKELNLVVKGDVAGSVEALADSLYKLSREEVKVNILHKGAGNITESDVMLAAASNAVVIGFNVIPTAKAKKVADNEKIDVRLYNIIYDCINEIQLALEGLLTPEYKEEIVATVEVRKVFKISKYGSIAGCYVLNGKISRNDKVRLLRDGFKEFEGSISSLKRNKDDVKEVDQGFECGIQLNGYSDILDGDIIEAFKINEVKRKLV